MNWKYDAIDKLWDYEARKRSLENIPKEIRRLETDYQQLRCAARDLPPEKGGSRREDMMLSNIFRRTELSRQLESAQAWVELVESGLEVLSEEDRLILDRFYIHRQKGACERLCEELDREKAQVYRRRDRALRQFTLALCGGTET